MRPNYRSVTTFCTASVNNVMTFSAYKSDRNIFYKQFNFRLAPRTFGLVTSSNSLPEGQPHLFIFVSPCFVFNFSTYKKKFTYDVLSGIATCLLDGTVFEIVKGLEDIQQLSERNLLNKRMKLVNSQKGKTSLFSSELNEIVLKAHEEPSTFC